MADEYFTHITEAGDRWDLIAYEWYGDATLIKPILLANPALVGNTDTPVPLILKRGTEVRVPVLETSQIAQAQLPPWKRS